MDKELEKKKLLERSGKTKEQILEFIDRFGVENGYAPTVREIGYAVGLKSTASVQAHLDIMEKDGLIQKGNKARTIKILDKRYSRKCEGGVQVPFISEFTENLSSRKNIAGYLTLPGQYAENGMYVAAPSDSVSIHAEGIMPGDILLIRLTDTVFCGQRILIRTGEGNTIICCTATRDIQRKSILGNVTGIFRSFVPETSQVGV